jgi:hypothetical protein
MAIKVSGPDARPGLFTDDPNPPIDGIFPFPETDKLAINTFNSGGASGVSLPDNNPIDGIIPGANTPLPAASTVAPGRVMLPLPAIFMQPPKPPSVGNTSPPPLNP